VSEFGDDGVHRFSLAGQLSLQQLGVRVQALLTAEKIGDHRIDRAANDGKRRFPL
jgi:hypothetical protein